MPSSTSAERSRVVVRMAERDDTHLLREYIAWKQRYGKWRTAATVRVRTNQLRRLVRFLAERDVTVATADRYDLRDWVDTLDVDPDALASAISAVKGLYGYVVDELELRADDPSRKLHRPRIVQPTEDDLAQRTMPEEDADRALAYASGDEERFLQLALIFILGLRCCELAWADTRDLVTEPNGEHYLYVHGKGLKGRTEPVPDALMDLLRPRLRGPNRPLFPRPSDEKHHTPNGMSRKLNDFLHDVVGSRFTAHSGRHRFGTDYFEQHPNLLVQARLMGHASTTTTARYTRTRQKEALPHLDAIANKRLSRAPKPRRRRSAS